MPQRSSAIAFTANSWTAPTPRLALVSARSWLRHATERDLHRVVDDLLELLANRGERNKTNCATPWQRTSTHPANNCPFGHPADWAAFGYWGL